MKNYKPWWDMEGELHKNFMRTLDNLAVAFKCVAGDHEYIEAGGDDHSSSSPKCIYCDTQIVRDGRLQ